jgi:tetratricopeptide (TPR) repeat protein
MRRVWIRLAICLVLLGASQGEAASRDAVKWNNSGAELVKQEKLDEAVVQFQQAVALDPGYAAAQQNLAYTYDRLGRADEAFAAYKRAADLDPGNPTVFNNLGVLCMKKGLNDDAIQTFEQGLKADPTNASLQKNLENARNNRGILQEREAQIADAKKLAAARPKDPRAAYGVARIYAFYRQNDQALEWLGKAMELGFDDPEGAKADPVFGDVRNDPRFAPIVAKR